MSVKKLHEKMLYTVARVSTDKAGGSGTLIYSQPDPKDPKKYINLVLTNEHVVDAAITTKKAWDSILKRQREKEILEPVKVEMFNYVDVSRMDSAQAFRGLIVAYDKAEDMAIVKLDTPKPLPYIAKMIPRKEIDKLKLFHPIYAVGCTFLHDPFCNHGYITYYPEIIEQREYWMGSANISFGNSGGGVFTADKHELIGIPSRVTVAGFQVVNWMGYFITPERLYKFFEDQELKFIYDPDDDWYSALKRREKKERQALAALAAELSRGEEE